MEQTVNILGTRYIVAADSSKVEKGNDGQCENYNKAIYVKDKDDILDEAASPAEKSAAFKEVMRHELVHAFFNEAGLDEYRCDELLVQWLAKQFPKMMDVMREVGSI